jgi:hypothetical protein
MGIVRALSCAVLLCAGCGGPTVETAGGRGSQTGTSAPAGRPPSLAPTPLPTGPSGGAPGAPGGDGPTCGTESAKAERLPVDIFILQDRSMSMLMPAQPASPTSKWDAIKAAVTQFLQSPGAEGLGVGLGFFPPMAMGQACNPATYAMPAVPIAPLPGAAMPIVDALAATMPGGNTPTRPALDGVIQYAQAWQTQMHRRVAIALATDGQPNQCQSSVASVSASAATGAGMGILTFVIGVGPLLQNLDAIAQAGGTKMAFQVAAGTADQLVAAFKAIQMQAALACTFAVPAPPSGQSLDPMRVNVRFNPNGTMGAATDLGMVSGLGQCGAQGGWYFDNPAAPTSVTLCDASCQVVNAAPNASISLVFGCKTNVIQ